MNLFAGRSTVHRLHLKVQRNIVKNHKRRYESSKRNTGQTTPSRSVSSTTSPTETSPPPRSWSWSDPILRPFKAYDQMQKRSPLWTQWESAIIIYFLGDLSSQAIVNDWFETERYEPIRGLRSMTIGAIAAIPGYKWFGFLSNHFNYRSHVLSLAAKIGLHQAFFVPAFNSYFFGMQCLLAGGSWQEAKERVWNTVPTSWYKSCQFWPIVNAFNFSFVPVQHRSVFTGVIAIGWQTYLSWLNRSDESRQQQQNKQAQKEAKAASSKKQTKSGRKQVDARS